MAADSASTSSHGTDVDGSLGGADAFGDGGNDGITAGATSTEIDGGPGSGDVENYFGPRADYDVSEGSGGSGDYFTFSHNASSGDGEDRVYRREDGRRLVFDLLGRLRQPHAVAAQWFPA